MDTERTLRRYRDAGVWPAEEALAAMLDNQFSAFSAVRLAIPSIAASAAASAERLGVRGRLIYCGAGASGRLAVQDGVELHPTFGWPTDRLAFLIAGGEAALRRSVEGAEDDADAGAREAAALHLAQNDVLMAVAASGITRYTRVVQETARAAGALTVAMANNPGAPLLEGADHPVLLRTGPEFLAGSTRMTAGTAQKIALNLFSTRLMTELGRVYQGHMVDMVPSNAKLVARARGMVATIAGVPAARAASALKAAGGSVKVAVLMLDGLNRSEAEARLAAAVGRLDRARGS
ncbi:MAG TPA: N-acetylmuramic acid 6-phosphate etherase [Rhodopila sp.]|jgi:N-acetylmuramic acid 6-phosphate etherase